jgi:chromosome segregation ATPase
MGKGSRFSRQKVVPVGSRSEDKKEMQKNLRESHSRDLSARKEHPPIIISNDDQFAYKAPSLIHETVVNTLRKEKDQLQRALQSQREMTRSLEDKLTQQNMKLSEMEAVKQQLLGMAEEDKQALDNLDRNYQALNKENFQLKERIKSIETHHSQAISSEKNAFR